MRAALDFYFTLSYIFIRMMLSLKHSRLAGILMAAALCHFSSGPGWSADSSRPASSPIPQAEPPIIAASANGEAPDWLLKPLTLADCLNIALVNNSQIRKSQFALEAATGQAIVNRAIVVPKVVGTMGVNRVQERFIEQIPIAGVEIPTDRWSSAIQVQQKFFQGGRIVASLKVARHLQEQALFAHQTAIADTLTQVRIKFYDVLLAIEEIKVNEASVKLLENELQDSQRRFKADVVPRFNVLRAEVQLANAKPPLIKARNDYRIAKNDLCNLLGYDIPKTVWDDIPLTLLGELEAEPFDVDLGAAMAHAIGNRPELGALREAEKIAQQEVYRARSGYFPGIIGYGGYQSKSSDYKTDLTDVQHGWVIGGELNWNIFDGLQTKGLTDTAKANLSSSREELLATARNIEVEVRSTYSTFVQAKETLESQMKNVELATEALRLARALQEAGSGTQLDVLDAETSLTQARTTWVNALRNYAASLASLERAIGLNIMQETAGSSSTSPIQPSAEPLPTLSVEPSKSTEAK